MKALWLLPVALCAACGGAADSSGDRGPHGTTQTVTAAPSAGLRTYAIVPGESRASYHANEEFFAGAMKLIGMKPGKVGVVGTTQAITGTFQIDPASPVPRFGENSFSVQLNTLTSNQRKRDDYLREIRDDGGPSFDAYPTATFKATTVTGRPGIGSPGEFDLQLSGDLTIRDVTKRVVFDVKGKVAGDVLTGVGGTKILLSDFGIGPIEFADILSVADPVEIEVAFTARAQL